MTSEAGRDAKGAKFLTSFPDWGNRSGKTTQERGMEKGMEKVSRECSSILNIKVDNPLMWLKEVIQNEYRNHDF